jgi:ATP-binding cassette subfamily B protein
MRNTLLRFLELINTPAEEVPQAATVHRRARGMRIDFEAASVVVAGHTVLEEVTLAVQPGEHIGIVGASGAGKSSLLGCLLGWYLPQSGYVRIDGVELDAQGIARLRRDTAWIDPQAHLFGESLYANLQFGNEDGAALTIEEAVETNGLGRVLSRMPDGLQTSLGEGGSLVSGGEGQRIRVARACRRADVRLALLDEPARGLGREQRRLSLAGARRQFAGSTLLCVTHDVSHTVDFDRIVVIERGRIVEQGTPQVLQAREESRYAQLLAAEAFVTRDFWAHAAWRRMRLQSGVITENPARAVALERYRA